MFLSINKVNFAAVADWKSIASEKDGLDLMSKSPKRYYNIVKTAQDLVYLAKFSFEKKPSGKIYCLGSAVGFVVNKHGESKPEANTSSFVFVHQVKNRILFIGYRDGSIDINTDLNYDKYEAGEQIAQYISRYGIDTIYHVGTFDSLEDFLVDNVYQLNEKHFSGLNKSFLVQDSQSSKKYKDIIIGSIFLIGSLSFAFWLLKDSLFEDNQFIQEKTNTGPTEAEIIAYKKQALKAELKKLYSVTYPSSLMDKCAAAKNIMVNNLGDWEKGNFICSQSKVSFSFIRNEFGYEPSHFLKEMSGRGEFDVSVKQSFPIVADVAYPYETEQRSFVPQSVSELNPIPINSLLDVLARFGDVATVSGFVPPTIHPMGIHNLEGKEITFTANELWKESSFNLKTSYLSQIYNALELLDKNYVFVESINNKGKYYETKVTVITE